MRDDPIITLPGHAGPTFHPLPPMSDESIRFMALKLAVEIHRGLGSYPHTIISCAEELREYIRGNEATND